MILVKANSTAAYWQVITTQTVRETGDSFTVTVPASQEFAAAARNQLETIAARQATWCACLRRTWPACRPRQGDIALAADRLGAARLADRLAAGRFHAMTTSASLTDRPPSWNNRQPCSR